MFTKTRLMNTSIISHSYGVSMCVSMCVCVCVWICVWFAVFNMMGQGRLTRRCQLSKDLKVMRKWVTFKSVPGVRAFQRQQLEIAQGKSAKVGVWWRAEEGWGQWGLKGQSEDEARGSRCSALGLYSERMERRGRGMNWGRICSDLQRRISGCWLRIDFLGWNGIRWWKLGDLSGGWQLRPLKL